MKRKLLFVMLLLVAALCAFGVAVAETDPIVCSMEVSPSKLAAPGDVDVTITVSNSGDADMKDPLTLYNPVSQVVEDFGDKGSVTLKAGESKTWTGKWSVNQRTLENGSVVFFAKYTLYKDSGEAYSQSQPIRGKIDYQTAAADIEIKRTITPGAAREGQDVTVQYDIVNTGTVALKSISVQEHKNVNSKAQTVKELKPGETAQIKFTVKMKKKDITSKATVTYQSEDSSKKQTVEIEEQVIVYGEPKMSAKLTSSAKGVAVNGTVTLTLELKNNGNIEYSDLRVTDPKLGEVFANQKLAAGGSLKLDKEITLTETTDYQFTVSAIDSTGTSVDITTDKLTLTAVDPNKILHLTVEASSDRTEVYESPGVVRFSLKITNDSEVDAKDVAIKHGETRIDTLATLPAGTTKTVTRDVACTMAGKYRFTAATTDALENTVSFDSNDIQIAFSVPTPAPATATPPPIPTAEPTYQPVTYVPISDKSVGAAPKTIRNIAYPLMFVSGALLVACIALLVIATKKRRDQKKASDAAYDHLERVKRRDYIAPNEDPIEKPEAAPEAVSADAPDEDSLEDLELPHMKYVRNAYEREGKNAQSFQQGLFDEEPLTDGYADGDMYESSYYDDMPAQAGEQTDESYDAYDAAVDAPVYDDATSTEGDAYDEQPGEYETYADDRYGDVSDEEQAPTQATDEPQGRHRRSQEQTLSE